MKIGLLGGTFDPIHDGHLELARTARKQFGLEKVIFIPARIPPHKTSRADITPAEHRFNMVKLAVQSEPAFEVSRAELDRSDLSYTVETLRQMKKRYPKDELYLILGADSLKEIPAWKEPAEIKRLAALLVAGREGVPMEGTDCRKIEMPVNPVSSSAIRQAAKQGKSLRGRVPEAVATYIQQQGLYR